MTPSASSTRAVDLRQEPVDEVMERVERALQTSLDRDSVVCKRRTVGARSDSGTWVRIERRPFTRIGVQGWDGTESAALLAGVVQPTWRSGVWPPRGLDSASLWAQSLAVPELADRVRTERRCDLESRDGKVMALFVCAKIAGLYAHPGDPRLLPARLAAEQLVEELQRN